ncbi:MAG: hypothetical protein A3C55_04005 [Gammaproteobacteria bacterium RIFCSPHIGHO2_02_FULL_42_13]|nr:MAG: hypothetical protein A3C55_04005 [Gammaproteobacteria bacterium RIFCSPHIGHO2_02_FULL_42_13]
MDKKKSVNVTVFIILFALLPLIFNFTFTMICFMNFAAVGSNIVEGFANFIFWVANWPSLLLKIYPYVLSTNGEVVYKMTGWLTPKVLISNSLCWGLVGLLVRKFTRRKNEAI